MTPQRRPEQAAQAIGTKLVRSDSASRVGSGMPAQARRVPPQTPCNSGWQWLNLSQIILARGELGAEPGADERLAMRVWGRVHQLPELH